MRFTLKDYQTDAVDRVLKHLDRAREDTERRGDLVSFALSAVTGAGKTVIATAVFEALFNGSDDFEFEPDPGAVVLWVTDDPSLNEQTRDRLIQAGDKLDLNQLRVIEESSFNQERFDPQTIYFLNIQKLSVSSRLTKYSDTRTFTIWDTIRNTIEDDQLTLYLVLDEAHRGMRTPTAQATDETTRTTIVQRLINGHNGIPPAPIVWGISATVQRFLDRMQAAQYRTMYSAVAVDARDVQESGLLKDVITLDFPGEQGAFETTFLRSSLQEMRESSRLWAEYAEQEDMTDPVLPLMVLQVPNTPRDAGLIEWLDVIREEWPELGEDAVAHVFGDHTDLSLGQYTVPYIKPQDVQEAKHVRILFAKDAISTGWDCPRAEVLFSLRPARDRTHITQLLGRMVRTPLARRIESDERLNTVNCFLPLFDQKTAVDVADVLTGKKADPNDPDSKANEGLDRKALTSPLTMGWNPNVPEDLAAFLATLPSESAPKADMRPIKRLLGLAAELAIDELVPNPNERAYDKLYSVLDGRMAQNQHTVDRLVNEINTAAIGRLVRHVAEGSDTVTVRQEVADARTVDEVFRRNSRSVGIALANGYVKRLMQQAGTGEDEFDPHGAKARVAALLSIDGVVEALESEAEEYTNAWLNQLRTKIKLLNEERRARYDEIARRARSPQRIEIVAPKSRIENTRDAEGTLLETRPKHLLSDERGEFPIGGLNDWEQQVIDEELGADTTIAWYRNPSRPSSDALQVPYQMGDAWKPMQPDFIFFSRKQDGTYAASIVDPHGDHLADALPKLMGLADFAEKYEDEFIRIEAISKVGKELRMLDMRNPEVRAEVREASSAQDVYRSDVAVQYSLYVAE